MRHRAPGRCGGLTPCALPGSRSTQSSLWPLVQQLGAPLFSLLICCMDMVPFVPCGPAAFTSGALYGSYVGAWPPPPLLHPPSVEDSSRAYSWMEDQSARHTLRGPHPFVRDPTGWTPHFSGQTQLPGGVHGHRARPWLWGLTSSAAANAALWMWTQVHWGRAPWGWGGAGAGGAGFATAMVGQQAAAVSAFLVGRHVLARIARHGQGGLKPPELSELKPYRGVSVHRG
jgi:hypothetical protein